MDQPRPLFVYFRSFQTNKTIFTTNKFQNVHLVYGAGIQTFRTWVITHYYYTRAPSLIEFYLRPFNRYLGRRYHGAVGTGEEGTGSPNRQTIFGMLPVWPVKSRQMPKMISLEKLKILIPLQKLPKNMGDWGKLIAAKGFEKLPKVSINHPIWSHWSYQQWMNELHRMFCIIIMHQTTPWADRLLSSLWSKELRQLRAEPKRRWICKGFNNAVVSVFLQCNLYNSLLNLE